MKKSDDWATKARYYMVEVAALLSLGMFLAWSLWAEYCHLFKVSH